MRQTFISYLLDEKGKYTDFQRWSYKRVGTILKKNKELYKHIIFKNAISNAKTFAIYATPNGCNSTKELVLQIPIEELLA